MGSVLAPPARTSDADPTPPLPDEIADAIGDFRNAVESECAAYEHGRRHLGQSADDARAALVSAISGALERASDRALAEATRNAHAVEPESQTVGQLNTSVRVLREEVYQQRLRAQAAESESARLREALRGLLGTGEPVEETDDPPTCRECGDEYLLDDGADPTPECHPCAQSLLARVRAALSSSPETPERMEAMDKTQVSPGATAGGGTSPTTASAARCDATEREFAGKVCGGELLDDGTTMISVLVPGRLAFQLSSPATVRLAATPCPLPSAPPQDPDYAPGFPRSIADDPAEHLAAERDGSMFSGLRCPAYSPHDWSCSLAPDHAGDHIASDGDEILDRWEAP